MEYILLSILISGITSIVVTKIEAERYFEVVNGYVNNLIELAKRHIKEAYASRGKQ